MEPAAAIAGLFLVAAQGAALGAILTFAGTPLYESTAADALAAQQLAGLITWVPGGAPYAAAAAWVVARAVGHGRSAELAVVRRGAPPPDALVHGESEERGVGKVGVSKVR